MSQCHSSPKKDVSEGQFLKVKPRAQSSLEDAQKYFDSEKESVADESHSLLFSCPEEGCIKTSKFFLPHSITWIVADMNALLITRLFLTEQCMDTHKGSRSSLVVYHTCRKLRTVETSPEDQPCLPVG